MLCGPAASPVRGTHHWGTRGRGGGEGERQGSWPIQVGNRKSTGGVADVITEKKQSTRRIGKRRRVAEIALDIGGKKNGLEGEESGGGRARGDPSPAQGWQNTNVVATSRCVRATKNIRSVG